MKKQTILTAAICVIVLIVTTLLTGFWDDPQGLSRGYPGFHADRRSIEWQI